METATRNPAHAAEPHGDQAPQVEEIDPEHDIDARATTYWLISALAFVLVCMWALHLVFDYSVAGARKRKIDEIAPVELRDLRAQEDAWLQKKEQPPANDKRSLSEIRQSIRKSTDRVISSFLQSSGQGGQGGKNDK